jgi:hypothetical protein
MKNRIIALVVGMILLLCSSLFAQAPDTLWTRTYGGYDEDLGRSVLQTTDGGYIIAGATLSFGVDSADAYMIKTDSVGNMLWFKTYGGIRDEGFRAVQETSGSGYIWGGSTNSFGAGAVDFYVIRSDSMGETLWTRTYGGNDWDGIYSLQKTLDGGYILAGYTE